VKHDGVQRGLIGEIIRRFENRGLRVVALKLVNPSKELIEKHYAEHRERYYYDDLFKFSTSGTFHSIIFLLFEFLFLPYAVFVSGPMVAMVWEGPNAVKLARRLIGATSIYESDIGSIRGDFALTR
jgi:nucleoside-diphosphate kinase